MKSLRYDETQLFDAFIKSAQYLARLKAQQDIWEHVAKFIVKNFPADWAAFVQRDPVNGMSILYCTLPRDIAAECIATEAVGGLVEDVLDSGFMAWQAIPAMTLSMTVFLPVAGEQEAGKVMLVGHETDEPLSKGLINVYLAIAGLAGTTFDRLQSESELKRYQVHLEELVRERTAELEAFSYSVSHDLRSPLRAVDAFSLELLEDYSDKLDDNGKDSLKRIRTASQRMGVLIDGLLTLSRVSRVDLGRKTVNLSAVAKDIANGLKMIQPEREAEFIIAEGLIVQGDEQLLAIALQNLLENSWKFTEKQTNATIEFGVLEMGVTRAYFVRDNGAGFDMTYSNKLFMPFQRLHHNSDFPGTGIGLATVNRIIQRHGGRIWAEGAVEKGATFYFTVGR